MVETLTYWISSLIHSKVRVYSYLVQDDLYIKSSLPTKDLVRVVLVVAGPRVLTITTSIRNIDVREI